MKLTEKQRRHLRGLGHTLDPVIQIGQAGASNAVIQETERALDDHELIKVRVSGMERDARDEAIEMLAACTGSDMVGRIGHVALLFRRNEKKPKVQLPDG